MVDSNSIVFMSVGGVPVNSQYQYSHKSELVYAAVAAVVIAAILLAFVHGLEKLYDIFVAQRLPGLFGQ